MSLSRDRGPCELPKLYPLNRCEDAGELTIYDGETINAHGDWISSDVYVELQRWC